MLRYDQPPPRRTLLPSAWFTEPDRFTLEQAALARHLPWRYAGLVGDDVGPGPVDRCGGLLFRRQMDNAPALSHWLGPFAQNLQDMSAQLDSPVGEQAIEFAANWKILVENTLDDFHGSTVHPESIHPAVDADWRTHLHTDRAGPHSRSSWALSPTSRDWWQRVCARGRLRRYALSDRYVHTFIFPDLYVASFFGALVIVHRVVPMAVDRTRLQWRSFLPLLHPDDRKDVSFRRSLTSMLAQSALQVIKEDRPLCEQVQQARQAALGPGMLGWREQRIGDVHDALTALLATTAEGP